MTPREWFEGVLGWAQPQAEDGEFLQAIQSPEGKLYVTIPPIWECQSAWIEHVVKPMREMGWHYEISEYKQGLDFEWWKWDEDNHEWHRHDSPIVDDNIFQASLDAAEKCPEVKERLQEFKNRGKLDPR